MKKRIYTIESASILVFAAVLTAACGPSPKGETAGSYLDDATVTGKVKAAIALNSRLSSLDIRVETDKGIVQLSGFVDSAEQIKEASHIASGVVGVKSVRNNLIVRQRGSYSNPSRSPGAQAAGGNTPVALAFGRAAVTNSIARKHAQHMDLIAAYVQAYGQREATSSGTGRRLMPNTWPRTAKNSREQQR
jgi:hypothetical protein